MHADVSSANIVGFQYATVPYGWSTFTPTFKDVSKTAFDLLDITPCKTNDNSVLNVDGKVSIRKIDPDGNWLTAYHWYGAAGKGWVTKDVDPETGRETGTVTPVVEGQVKFTAGEGVALYNIYQTGSKTKTNHAVNMLVSGEVDLVCMNIVPYGWSVAGNSTPIKVDLYNVTVLATNNLEKLNVDGKVYLRKIDPDANFETAIHWYPKTSTGCCWVRKEVDPETGKETGVIIPIVENEVVLNPGEGFAINDTYQTGSKTKTNHAVILQLPTPIEK